MEHQSCILSDIPGFGRVYDCGDCGNIHVGVGPVTLTLSPESFMHLVTLVHTSRANFEAWMNRRGWARFSNRPAGGSHADDDIDNTA